MFALFWKCSFPWIMVSLLNRKCWSWVICKLHYSKIQISLNRIPLKKKKKFFLTSLSWPSTLFLALFKLLHLSSAAWSCSVRSSRDSFNPFFSLFNLAMDSSLREISSFKASICLSRLVFSCSNYKIGRMLFILV